MKKNCMKGLFSFVIAGMMTLSMFSVAGTKTVVNAEDATTQWTVSKSKTATALDTNNETQVTLSLPSKQEQLTSDVLFVMDVSSCTKDAADMSTQIFADLDAQIKANNASVKAGLVVFKGNAAVAVPLEDISKAKTDIVDFAKKLKDAKTAYDNKDGGAAYKALIPSLMPSGSNLSAGLACAKNVLDNSNDGVANNRKHMVLVSDGGTYLFCKENGKDASGNQTYDYTSAWTREMNNAGTVCSYAQDGTIAELNVKYKTLEEEKSNTTYAQWAPSNWTSYLTNLKQIDLDQQLYKKNYVYDGSDHKDKYMDTIDGIKPVINIEESFLQSADIYQQMQNAGYDCHTYTTNSKIAPIFTGFMNYLAGGSAQNILTVGNEIFYMLNSGNVYDEMGTDTDYAFSFVNDSARISLTVDGTVYTAKSVAAANGETSVYEFRSSANEATAPYVVHYYAASSNTKEHIVWDINVPVTELARVQLTYAEKLTTIPTTRGDHTLNTNGITTLNATDSNGKTTSEDFTSPTVVYTVAQVTPVTPASPDPVSPARPTTPVTPTNTDNTETTTNTAANTTNARPSTPSTGDETNSLFYAGMFAASAAGIFLILVLKRKYFEA